MSKKFNSLDKDEKQKLESELNAASQTMGLDSYEPIGTNGNHQVLKDLLGICYNCDLLRYCKTEFGNVVAYCCEFKIRLHGQNRMIECNCHSPKNVLSLQDMYSMATLIEPAKPKVDGFISDNPKLRKGEKLSKPLFKKPTKPLK